MSHEKKKRRRLRWTMTDLGLSVDDVDVGRSRLVHLGVGNNEEYLQKQARVCQNKARVSLGRLCTSTELGGESGVRGRWTYVLGPTDGDSVDAGNLLEPETGKRLSRLSLRSGLKKGRERGCERGQRDVRALAWEGSEVGRAELEGHARARELPRYELDVV